MDGWLVGQSLGGVLDRSVGWLAAWWGGSVRWWVDLLVGHSVSWLVGWLVGW